MIPSSPTWPQDALERASKLKCNHDVGYVQKRVLFSDEKYDCRIVSQQHLEREKEASAFNAMLNLWRFCPNCGEELPSWGNTNLQ